MTEPLIGSRAVRNIAKSATQALAGNRPAGETIRDEERFLKLQTEIARRSGPGSSSARVDWAKVVALSGWLLRERGKDLVVAVWLASGLTRTGGLEGLRAGAELLVVMCSRFWATMTPTCQRLGPRLSSLQWWAAESAEYLKEMAQENSGALPPPGPYRAIINQLKKLTVFLDRAAPGWEPGLANLIETCEGLRRKRRLKFLKRVLVFFLLVFIMFGALFLDVRPAAEPVFLPADELTGYVQLPRSNASGWGLISDWAGHYDSQGRFIVCLPLTGKAGAVKVRSDMAGRFPVTAVDLTGDYHFRQSTFKPFELGPVSFLRLGRHEGFLRLSVNYAQAVRPGQVSDEVVFFEAPAGEIMVALRLTFRPEGR
ncbi:MAG: type VI secretion system ImpA family N-terminal domain-containing protein [Deltaproteobacteria bacterium]|jgi:hypothetical protein|nr:type VI secretion system ImpA family N-terminal domain-containing protein [Deltaproteobacteria bacterium]